MLPLSVIYNPLPVGAGPRAVHQLPRHAARAGDRHAKQGVRARHRLHVPPAQQLLQGHT